MIPAEELIHFHGSWTRDERAAIASTIQQFEDDINVPVPRSIFGKAWICVKEPMGSSDSRFLFVARRANVRQTFQAYSLPELQEKLQLF